MDIIEIVTKIGGAIGTVWVACKPIPAFVRWLRSWKIIKRQEFEKLQIQARADGEKSGESREKQTIILLPAPSRRPFWWIMGSLAGKPAMQVNGLLQVTNISPYDVVISGAKLREPKANGSVFVKDIESGEYGRHRIGPTVVTAVDFRIWVTLPVKQTGEVFVADVAILDQFGNEHWINGVEFQCLG